MALSTTESTVVMSPSANVAPTEKPQKLSKLEVKRQQQFVERLKRTQNKHKCDAKQALEIMQREDYEAMSPKEHVKRLESAVSQAFQGVGQDVNALKANDSAIADAFDVNYRGVADLFTEIEVKLLAIRKVMFDKGLVTREEMEQIESSVREPATKASIELQKKIMGAVKAEFDAERAAKQKAREEAQKTAADAAEKARVEAEVSSVPTLGGVSEEGTPPPPPEDATTFGG